jgi:tetratricopeptide (TPR) repeat protein
MKKSNTVIKAKQKASQLLQANRLDDAWAAYEQISRQTPGDHEVWLNLGAIAAMQGRLESAEASLRRALMLRPDLPQANINMARLLMMKNRLEEARPYLQSYVKLQPKVLDGYYQLGHLCEALGDEAAAEQVYRDALLLEEKSAGVHIGLGRVLRARGEHDEARAQCERALQLQPNAAIAYLELGNIDRDQRRFDEALHCYQQLLALAPHERENYLLNIALLYTSSQHYDEALDHYQQLFRYKPDSVSGHWNYSLLLLLLGRYKEGWDEYEWRWHTSTWTRQMWGKFQQPLWNGESLAGRTILVYAEQGLGDAIQFGRYLQPLMQQAGQVIFHSPPELLGLFTRIPGLQVEMRDYERARQQQFDFHLPLMSLARVMGTTLETIPATTPYLQPDPERVAAWRSRINRDGFKIGLVWGGSIRNASNLIRSMKLSVCEPLAAIPGVALYSLQKDADAAELKLFADRWGMVDLGPELRDFDDTAAVIENLDLVISVDTAVAHMAGALGRPVWTLVYQPTEWRWLLERDDSPWYPSMRLFRQTFEEPCWPPVIERVSAALRDVVAAQEKECL